MKRFVALVSGGKDSIFAIQKLVEEGYELVGLVHMVSKNFYDDSFMYQTVGTEIAKKLGTAFDVPLFTYETKCKSIDQSLEYRITEGDEIEDLYFGLKDVLSKIDFEFVSSGAILSSYQKYRVENVCNRLGLGSLAPLWQLDQKSLLNEMISSGIKAIIVKIASPIFSKENMGMNLSEIYKYMNKHDIGENYCGEGGEYESIVLDCKLFKKQICFSESHILTHPEDKNKSEEQKVYFLKIEKVSLVNK